MRKRRTQRTDYELAKLFVDCLSAAEYPLPKYHIEEDTATAMSNIGNAKKVFDRLIAAGVIEMLSLSRGGRNKSYRLSKSVQESYEIFESYSKVYDNSKRGSGGESRKGKKISSLGEMNEVVEEIKIEQVSHIIGQFVEQEVAKATKTLYGKYKDLHTEYEQAENDKKYFSDLCKEKQDEIDTLRKDGGVFSKMFGSPK